MSSARAIILKGPLPSSKSFFTVLPSSLEEMASKAATLFPVPAGHTGQLVLDNGAILMPDVLPFLHDREILTFRHAPDTPRSSLKRNTSSDMARERSNGSSSSAAPGSDDNVESSGGSSSSRASRSVRWSDSVAAHEDKIHKSAVALAPAKPARYSAAGRAEHARRVLGEQEQRRQRELAEASKDFGASGASSKTKEAGHSSSLRNDDPTASRSGKESDHIEQDKDPFLLSGTGETSMPQPFKGLTMDDLLVSGSSPPSYATATTTSHERLNSEEEQQGSSPVPSPTRNIRGAQRQGSEWMKPLGSDKASAPHSSPEKKRSREGEDCAGIHRQHTRGSEPSASVQEGKEQSTSLIEGASKEQANAKGQLNRSEGAQEEKNKSDEPKELALPSATGTESLSAVASKSNDEDDERAVEEAVVPAHSPRKLARATYAYQRMISIIDTLRGHPANVYFRDPICIDGESSGMAGFLQRTKRPVVDFYTIRRRLEDRQYGQLNPFAAVSADLAQMWANAKAYYGPTSNQARCAEFLERFGKVIMVEWRREADKSKIGDDDVSKTKFAVASASMRNSKVPASKFLKGLTQSANGKPAMPKRTPSYSRQSPPRASPSHRPDEQSKRAETSEIEGAKSHTLSDGKCNQGVKASPNIPQTQVSPASIPTNGDEADCQTLISLPEDVSRGSWQQSDPPIQVSRDTSSRKPAKRSAQWDEPAGKRMKSAVQPKKVSGQAKVPVVTVTDANTDKNIAHEQSPMKPIDGNDAPPQVNEQPSFAPLKEAALTVQSDRESESEPIFADATFQDRKEWRQEEATPNSSPSARGTKSRVSPRLHRNCLEKEEVPLTNGKSGRPKRQSPQKASQQQAKFASAPSRVSTRSSRRAQAATA